MSTSTIVVASERSKRVEERSKKERGRSMNSYVDQRDETASQLPTSGSLRDSTNKFTSNFDYMDRFHSMGFIGQPSPPCSGSLASQNSILNNGFTDSEDDAVENPISINSPNIEKAREMLMRLTCQGPLMVSPTTKTKKKDSPSHSTSTAVKPLKKPPLTQLHLELQKTLIEDLQKKITEKEIQLRRALETNDNLKEELSSTKEELSRVTKEADKLPRTRLRLELVETLNDMLHDKIASKDAVIKDLEDDCNDLLEELQESNLTIKQVDHEKGSLLKELRRRGKIDNELTVTNCLVRAQKKEIGGLKSTHVKKMHEAELQHNDKVMNLQIQLRALKQKYGLSPNDNENNIDDRNDPDCLKAEIQLKDESIAVLRKQVMDSESTRRKLHNFIQELRGNIRCFVRVRPFLDDEVIVRGRNQEIITPINVVGAGNALTVCGKNESVTYQFDKVYGPSSTQEEVFEELADFVQSALDGYSACIFAYGQTGSGKTHTMQGEGFGDMRGITPRAVEQILRAGNLMKHTWNFYVQANFVEIYNEKLVDLLSGIQEEVEFYNSCEDELLTLNPGINKGTDKLALRKDVLGQTFVEGLTNVMIDINNIEKGMAMVTSILKCAARARTVASTKMNDRSSRSHSVFTLDIAGKNIESGAVIAGSLHLVDLAGSERLSGLDDSLDPKQLRETTNINKSLSCLGDVFSALASEAGHVPYRNSKLTYLLQNCLGGDGKACMLVNLSPTIASSNETVHSLRFAQRVSQIEVGSGRKKVHLSKR